MPELKRVAEIFIELCDSYGKQKYEGFWIARGTTAVTRAARVFSRQLGVYHEDAFAAIRDVALSKWGSDWTNLGQWWHWDDQPMDYARTVEEVAKEALERAELEAKSG